MNNHQSGLRFLPPPFHHPGWRGHSNHEFRSQKINSSCLYASRCNDQEPSCLEFEAEKFSPAPQTEVPLLPGLETKEPAFPVRHSEPPQPTFATSSLQPSSLTTFPPSSPGQELTSAAPNRNLHACSPASSPSDFTEKRDYEVSILLKPNYGSGESKAEEEEKDEHFLQTSPSLDLSRPDKTSQGR